MAKRFKAAVIGGSGYGGGEMIRRLLMHPEVELARVASIDYVGEPLSAAHPSLEGCTDLVFQDLPAGEAARGMDVVLLGLPHKVSAHKVPEILEAGARIVDLSGDFRLRDVAAYERYYGATHPCPELIPRFVYGLPELNRAAVKGARYVASPGCFATTIELGLLPLARRGWLQGSVEVVAITGSSGSGVAPSAGTHHPVRAVNLKTYKTLAHQHTPEILETLAAAGAKDLALQFVPVSAPLSRGLFASSFAWIDATVEPDAVRAAYREQFASEPFVRVPAKRLPEVAAISGSNFAEVGCVVGEVVAGRRLVTCISALDNLIKGGAGQGIQNMNLILGLDETLSMVDPGELALKIVIKAGGELLFGQRADELRAIARDARALLDDGHRLLFIHGGGPQTTELMRALGQEPRIVGGRRITDRAALEAVEMMVGGKLNIELVSRLLAEGVNAVGFSGVSGRAISCVKRPPRVVSGGGSEPIDFGHVGDVSGVNHQLLDMLTVAGYVPVLACIAVDAEGRVYNINADAVANDVACAVGADRLLLLTGVPGVLRDKEDPASRIGRLTVAEGRQAIADGIIQGGMIPKLEESFRSLARGVGQIHVLGRVAPGDLRRALEAPGSVGTALLP